MSTARNGTIRVSMPDARHPKKYPKGQKHPKLPVTPDWKRAVLAKLELNRSIDRPPRNEAELARTVGADKGGLHDVLHGEQATYKYARQIADLLGIGDAMVVNPELTDDEWDVAVRRIRALSSDKQKQVLAILRTFDVDEP